MTTPDIPAEWMSAPAQSSPRAPNLSPRPSPQPLIRALRRARSVVLAADQTGVLASVNESVPTSCADTFALSERLIAAAHSMHPSQHSPERDAILKAASEVPS